jgi:short/branched chain acyl-CoA dehydrogenase
VKRFAQHVVGPKVREMDENEMMDPSVMKGLFEQGVRSSLPPFSLYITHVRRSSWVSKQGAEHGGAESSFTSTIIAIKELAKVDPSVSVLCDVHNTLVNTVIRKYGTPEQQEKWLPQLAESMARQPFDSECGHRPVRPVP